jgi:phage recombination protein Bet
MSNQLMTTMAERFNVPAEQMIHTLKQTCFKGPVTDAQMTALLIVAQQYSLNPWTKEIYAFPDKNNGIVPVVGVDGWSRIINGNPAFDGMDFEMAPDGSECTCRIYRKDRSHPISATEYMAECKRNAGPWLSHPRRMLRHKAMIQCARLAFGFAGIFDQDEAERIVERDITPTKPADFAAAADTASDSPETLTIIAALQDVAAEGNAEALQTRWQSLTKEQRKATGAARWEEIKRLLVIEGEASEVPE